MAKTLRPLPARLMPRHIGRKVKIREENRGAVIRRCYSADHSCYIGAGGIKISRPDEVFYQPGVILNLSTDGRRCLVEWPIYQHETESRPALWLDSDLIEASA